MGSTALEYSLRPKRASLLLGSTGVAAGGGTFSSTKDLTDYTRQDTTKVLQTTDLIKELQPFTLVNADKNLITQMTNKYVSLAVKATTIDTQLTNNSTVVKAVVSKVPGKNIFVIDAKKPDGTK